MTFQNRLLSVAVVAALALPASAFAAASTQSPAAARALGLIDGHGKAAQRADADRFVVRDVIVDRNGTEHVRLDRTYRGLPVIGGDVVVHSRNGQLRSASLMLKTSERPGIVPRIKSDEAMVAAGADFHGRIDSVSSEGLVVYAANTRPVLAFEVRLKGVSDRQGEADMRYFVDANTGKVLDAWNRINTAE